MKGKKKATNTRYNAVYRDIENTFRDFIINMNIWYKVIITIIIILAICIYLYFDKKARRKVLRKGKKIIKEKLK